MLIRKKSEELYLNIKGVHLNLELNYDEGTVSFLNVDGSPQKFVFSERTVEYLGGWVKIARAIEEATIYADKLLREQRKLRDDEETTKLINIFTSIKMDKKK